MLELVLAHAYFFLIPLAILEGPFLAIACGVAAGLGYLNVFVAYGILIFGDLSPDLMYYWIGRYGATLPFVRRIASRTRLIRENFLPLEQLWRERPFTTLAHAKLAYGVAPVLIVSAGLSGVPFSRFVVSSLAVSTTYLGVLAGIGFGFARGFGYVSVLTADWPVYLGVAGVFFLSLLGYMMYRMRRHFDQGEAIVQSNLIEFPVAPEPSDR